MLRQAPHQTLHRLVLYQRDTHPARVLQTRGKEVDAPHRAVPKLHVHLPEIVLAEFAGQTLETYQRLDLLRPQRSYQAVQRALASRVTRLPHSPQYLHRRQVGPVFQNLHHEFPEILDLAGPANPPLASLRSIVNVHNGNFLRNTLDGAQGNSRQPRHFNLRVTRLQ